MGNEYTKTEEELSNGDTENTQDGANQVDEPIERGPYIEYPNLPQGNGEPRQINSASDPDTIGADPDAVSTIEEIDKKVGTLHADMVEQLRLMQQPGYIEKLEATLNLMGQPTVSILSEPPQKPVDPSPLMTSPDLEVEEPVYLKSIPEMLERTCDLACLLQNALEPVLSPGDSDVEQAVPPAYGSMLKNQIMKIYSILENISFINNQHIFIPASAALYRTKWFPIIFELNAESMWTLGLQADKRTATVERKPSVRIDTILAY